MSKIKFFAVPVIAFAAAFIMQGGSASAATCKIDIVDGPGNHGIKVNAAKTVASATVVVTGDANCRKPVTLAVWKLPNAQGQPISEQKFFGSNSKTYGPGRHTISTAIPACFWQADLLGQLRPKSVNGDANYQWPQDALANYRLGGDTSCTPPTQNPVAPTCEMSADKTSLPAGGGTVKLTWSSKHNQTASISEIGAVAKSGSKDMTVTKSTLFRGTFTNTKFNPVKTVTCDVTVTVAGTPTPTTPGATPGVTTAKAAVVPTSLPNTGAGTTVAAVSGLTATVSGVARYFFLKRKFLV